MAPVLALFIRWKPCKPLLHQLRQRLFIPRDYMGKKEGFDGLPRSRVPPSTTGRPLLLSVLPTPLGRGYCFVVRQDARPGSPPRIHIYSRPYNDYVETNSPCPPPQRSEARFNPSAHRRRLVRPTVVQCVALGHSHKYIACSNPRVSEERSYGTRT